MSTKSTPPRRWTTLSSAHEDPDLRKDNPLYERAGSARDAFHAERVEARESAMVKRQKPHPVLRPSQILALGPDSMTFNEEWREECRQARAHNNARER